jgi:signal transduction histidine kinase
MSAVYTLTLYPTEELFDVYSTTNPAVATVGAVLIVLFTSFVFLLYDLFVRQAFNEKDSVLNAKRQFMCFVSHEVRTPLNSVCMGLKFMQEEIEDRVPPDTSEGAIVPSSNRSDTNGALQNPGMTCRQLEEVKKLIEEILGNAESAVDVLNDFLNYDKIEMGKLSLELTIIPIWTLIEKTMVEFNIAAEAKSINFKLDFSPLIDPPHPLDASNLPRDVQECRVVGDAIRITQVLRNLVSNGLKFTPEGGKHHELKLSPWEGVAPSVLTPFSVL